METLSPRSESQLKRRSLLIRLLSRSVDWVAANGLILLGGRWYEAAAIGAVLNCAIDYLGQRYYVFTETPQQPHRSRWELMGYLGLRILFGLPAIGLLLLLYNGLGIPYFISSLAVTLVMWKVTFKDFQALFTGNTRDIAKPLQRLIARMRKGAHSG